MSDFMENLMLVSVFGVAVFSWISYLLQVIF